MVKLMPNNATREQAATKNNTLYFFIVKKNTLYIQLIIYSICIIPYLAVKLYEKNCLHCGLLSF